MQTTMNKLSKALKVLEPFFPSHKKVTYRKFEVLLSIFKAETETSSPDIMKDIQATQGSISKHLQDLQADGLIDRYQGTGANAKREMVALSSQGEALKRLFVSHLEGC